MKHNIDKTKAPEWATLSTAYVAHCVDMHEELVAALQCLVWKAKDQLYALKDSKNTYTDSSEYITQLKDYITNAESVIAKARKGA